MDDRELLAALNQAIELLSDARCCIEGEAALISLVNNDLTKLLRRLNSRAATNTQLLQPVAALASSQNSLPHIQQPLHQQHTQPGHAVAQPGSALSRQQQQQQQQQRAGSGVSRTPLTSSAYGQHAAPARQASLSSSRKAVAGTQQRPAAAYMPAASPARAVTAAATVLASHGVLHATGLFTTAQQQQQQPSQPDGTERSSVLPASLRPVFNELLTQYTQLQQQLDDAMQSSQPLTQQPEQQQHQLGLTRTAAAGFMAGLHRAFGVAPSTHTATSTTAAAAQLQQERSNGEAAAKRLPVLQFAQQAEFVRLAATALSAVQAASRAGADCASSASLQSLLPAVMQQCRQWLQAHSSQQQQQQQQVGQDLMDAAVRWRNRCMRSLLAATAATAAERSNAVVSTATSCGSGQLAVWLPDPCWQPLHDLHAAGEAGAGNRAIAAAAAAAVRAANWRLLSPAWQLQQQPNELLAGIARSVAANSSSSSSSRVQLPAVLCYQELQELQQHSRHMQKLQQLLLQLHVEQRLAPKLMECLLKGCLQLHKEAAAPADQQQQRGRQMPGRGAAADVLQERCLALYRLLHFLTAAAVKQRGLTASCHLAEAEVVQDVDLLRHSQW